MSKLLIAGLGNIGDAYLNTRHNIGFDMIDYLAEKHGAKFTSDRLAERTTIKIKGKTLVCIKPTTYMNLSGKAVKYWMDKENIDASRILVLVDELAIPLEKIKLKASGSDAGHNGLKSIHEWLGTTAYPRFRFGIGNSFPKGMQVDFVLGKWTKEELPIVKQKIIKSAEIIEIFALEGIESAMNKANNLHFTG
ncbi:aminoacyl-tRNA hydrolase [Pollutibacter soli]|uniref:aminoacyl-tRNA hydrolase n=1 Tax=Pollutibacter soli TaxID=3034157 RepID=UPI0030138AB8